MEAARQLNTKADSVVIEDLEHNRWLESLTETQYRSYHSRIMRQVLAEVQNTNGRVRSLEKFRYAAAGGLGVMTVVVVPLVLKVVAR